MFFRRKPKANPLQKCDVYLCKNKVRTKGALCKDCTEKLINPYSVIVFCPVCHKILLVKISDDLFFSDDFERIIGIKCIKCSQGRYPFRPLFCKSPLK
ncbi:MAG: hypothetical protein ACUVRG_10790 [Ignavibacterium sp.]|uniref:hypothetical protein n=1 Tax=Ignavibacterium sp. TaxID=2651167 RepID=UPI004049C97B